MIKPIFFVESKTSSLNHAEHKVMKVTVTIWWGEYMDF
jgi:hypothetical protein